jgi:sensor histidine kinase YesM
MGAVLILVFMVAYLFVRQNKIKAEQANSLLEQKLLRSQMNPHFIFNSLQAIQNYILKHDEKQAVKYLSSFAAVTRNVLENSRMDAIPLKKEISLLENYLQLQKLRFKSRFEYEIVVDEAIDTENTAIPPMLAQPFIENAVEHGFHDIHDGRITVLYALKEKELVMEIIDNGIGMKDGYSQSKQHRSLALEITRERVDLMNKKAKEKVLFDIGEAFPMLNERKGVKIRFFLPLRVQS